MSSVTALRYERLAHTIRHDSNLQHHFRVRDGRAGRALGRTTTRPREACRRLCRGRSPGARLHGAGPRPGRRVGHHRRRRARAHRRGGLPRPRRQGAGRRGHRVPHRVDDEELHRDGDPEAARRRQAVARRSRRTVRAGAQGPQIPDHRLAAHHDPPSALAFGRVPGRQPVGRPPPCRQRGRLVADAARRHSVLERARDRVRILQLRLRHPRPHRRQRVEDDVRRLRGGEHPQTARHDLDDARAGGRAAGAPRARLSLGGRAVEGRAAAGERLVRIDGRDADVGARSEPLRRRLPVGMAAARRPRDRADPAGVAARDAAAVASRGRHRSRAIRPARSSSTRAATASGSAFPRPVRTATSSRTAAACRDSGRS